MKHIIRNSDLSKTSSDIEKEKTIGIHQEKFYKKRKKEMKIEETNLRFRSSLVKGLQGLFQVASILRFPHFSYSVGFFFFFFGRGVS